MKKFMFFALMLFVTACSPQSQVFPWQRSNEHCRDVRIDLSVSAEPTCPHRNHYEPQDDGMSPDGQRVYYNCFCKE